jgi:signal transduction histidine kinase/phage shock protein PspC (stress-responsive transcriptional regulator)
MAAGASATPPLRRDSTNRIVAGVCSGLGRRLGLDPLILRVFFVVTTFAGGVGLIAYLVAWVLMRGDGAAERGPLARLAGSREVVLVASGIGLLVLAFLLLLREWDIWLGDALVWPVVLAATGGALIWRQSTAAPPAEPGERAPAARSRPWLRLPRDAASRAWLGALLVVGAATTFLWLNNAFAAAQDVALAVLVVIVAAALILAPWWLRLLRGLDAERAERIRSQERAEMAAHLHDSVLQTLALMQRRADDPREIAGLARRQERELRAWLNGARSGARADSLAGRLEAVAAEVEETHGVPVDVVAVGDAPVDDAGEAVVAAAREALVNAAKFAGGGPISLYAEVDSERLEVFVRDRGPGFDPEAVPADRRGVRESIVGRMSRHGGRASVHEAPGGGTEVELVMERRR